MIKPMPKEFFLKLAPEAQSAAVVSLPEGSAQQDHVEDHCCPPIMADCMP